jgi:hypothetical protein
MRLPILICAAAMCTVACAPRQTTSESPVAPAAGPHVVDDFSSLEGWQAVPAEGVRLSLHQDEGVSGQAMRLDVDVSRGGYAIARRELDLPLPDNYEITFWLRGELPPNTLEFKLVDATGENVWWHVQRDVEWPREWQRVRIRKRQISFAWGPRGGGDPDRVAALELAITAGAGGGSGSVWIDEIVLAPLDPVRPYSGTPVASADASAPGTSPSAAIDGDSLTAWRGDPAASHWLALDFGSEREYGGLIVHWEAERAADYDVEVSSDGANWETLHAVRDARGARDWIPLPETESRWLRLRFATAGHYGIRGLYVQPLEWAATPNDFLRAVAEAAPRGDWPRVLTGEQSYWTVIGMPDGGAEALISEDGALEPQRGGPAIEPFLHSGGRLLSWNDAAISHSLAAGSLPIPSVRWQADGISLEVTALADGDSAAPLLRARYRVTNLDSVARSPTLYLTVRPLQVNPPWQFLGTAGGVAPVHDLEVSTERVRVNGADLLVLSRPPDEAGASAFHTGNVVEWLHRRTVPEQRLVHDPVGHAGAAVGYHLRIPPGESRDVVTIMPMVAVRTETELPVASFDARLAAQTEAWSRELGGFRFEPPAEASDFTDAVRATLAWILINRNGAAIQPGTRSYRRSWIRDGSLTSSALLRLGHSALVRDYIEWYAPFQYENGKVPCCVDHRGADPVPEHDSHGQLIWLIAEYVRFTGDTALASRHWPRVQLAVSYMDSLRRSRMTEPYLTGDSTAYFGLLPQSISHEGYSERPMHSFWDDLFGLRGYKDAAWLAAVLGFERERMQLESERDRFRRQIRSAYLATMEHHGIDWLAGAVELGDFDATSTTVGVSPLNEAHRLPQDALHRTFERYLENFRARRDGSEPWEAYTPYEWRTVGTFVRLGRIAEAHEIAAWFMEHRRPEAWQHWAEVVWRDARAPRFIGDMPHGWVGSDFIRSVLDMVVYEREADSALVVGAGVPLAWATTEPGLLVEGIRTPYGTIDVRAVGSPDSVHVTLGGSVAPPRGGVIVHAPWGCTRADSARDTVVLRELPAQLTFHCGGAAPRGRR